MVFLPNIGQGKFQNTNPERGRKLFIIYIVVLLLLFQNTNPERGRKRNETRLDEPLDPLLISEHEPRKGTETAKCVMQGITSTNFRTRTPKGDGNVIGCAIVTPMS